jgi:hypothetical protein
MTQKITFLPLLFLNVLHANTLEITSIEQEKQKIAEIEQLLKNAQVPDAPLHKWIAEQAEVLGKSESQDILELAKLLDSLHKGQYSEIEGRKALSTFTKAVKVHNPDFSLGLLEGIKIVAAGTQWWRRS